MTEQKKDATFYKDKTILVAVVPNQTPEWKVKDELDELAFLAETAGYSTLKTFTQKIQRPDSRTFVGKGKLEEIRLFLEEYPAETVIFDDDLSPSQLRNIENELKKTVFDRSLLILEIFLIRAKTAQAKTQVELARYEYLLPRLTNMWTHLERQRGATGTRGGSGEKEIETDRRNIKARISLLKEQLLKIDKQAQTQRKARSESIRISLVGYTNAGKSTVMNLLSKADVLAENKLFATLDSTVRKMVLDNIPFLISDTVGFIRKLPHSLVESFKSTLDEVREADLLIHIVDVSNPAFEDHIHVVNKTLAEIGAGDKPVLLVFNKIDAYHYPEDSEQPLDKEFFWNNFKKSYASASQEVLFISAKDHTNVASFRETIARIVKDKHKSIYPHYLY
ncbi:MAG TPA: GTPase HflX [Cytophagaceae bacterium]|jgi:GTP-binding protein HflX|nr:GTPase HflX [Cytophagaceae bacterium]